MDNRNIHLKYAKPSVSILYAFVSLAFNYTNFNKNSAGIKDTN